MTIEKSVVYRVMLLFLVGIFLIIFLPSPADAFLGESALVIGGVTVSSTALLVGGAVLVAGGLVFATNEDCRNATIDWFKRGGESLINSVATVSMITLATGQMIAQVTDNLWQNCKDFISETFNVGSNNIEVPTSLVSVNGVYYDAYPQTYVPVAVGTDSSIVAPNGDFVRIYTEKYNLNAGYTNLIFELNGVEEKAHLVSIPFSVCKVKVYMRRVDSTGVSIDYSYGDGTNFQRSSYLFSSSNYDYEYVIDGVAQSECYTTVANAEIMDIERDYAVAPEKRAVYVNTAGEYANVTATEIQTTFETEVEPEPTTAPTTGEYAGVLSGISSKVESIGSWLTNTYNSAVNVLTGAVTGIGTAVSSIATTVSNVLSLEWWTDFFTVKSLDFSGLQNLVVFDKFPFCIPFDLIDTVKLFAVSASQPVFDININTEYLKVNHTIDLTPYNFYIAFFRYFVVVVFTLFLIGKTQSLIKW